MSTGARLAERLWDGAGRVYATLPQPLVDVIGRAHPLLALARGLRLPLAVVRGRTAATGASASVLLAGNGPDLDYLLGRFLAGPLEREPLGRVSLPELPTWLKRRREEHDLTLARLDELSGRALLGPEYLRAPDWLGTLLPLGGAVRPSSTRSIASDLARVRRNELRWHVSRDEADFERFHQTMYRPYARRRHGDLAIDRNVHQLRRVFRAGCLLWVTHRGQPLAAMLLLSRGHVLKLVVLGTIDGDLEALDLGALAALYLFSIEYADERGLTAVDLGGVRPCLSDGVLRYKRKWNVCLRPKPDVYHDFALYWPRWNAALAGFLADHPNGSGLLGLTAAAELGAARRAPTRLRNRLWTRGLQRLVVVDGGGGHAPVPREVSFLTPPGKGGSGELAAALHREIWSAA